MKKLFTLLVLLLCVVVGTKADVIGYTEAIDGTTLKGRQLTSMEHATIGSDLVVGSNIKDYKGTSKSVSIDGITYSNTDSWRKSQNGTYDGQNVGYKITIEQGYKLNISHIGAKIAVADDTYTWYVEILNASGVQVWKSGEKTTKKASAGSVDANVTDKAEIQGLTGTITVNLYVKQGGSTKYFSIVYLQLDATTEVDTRATYAMTTSLTPEGAGIITPADGTEITEGENVVFNAQPNTGYKFVKWTVDGTDYTENPYTIEGVNSTHTAVATFEALPMITFAAETDETIVGVLPSVDYAEAGSQYTIPQSYFLAKEGYTLIGWNDGTTTYAAGEDMNVSGDVTLTAVFAANEVALGDESTTITWPFAADKGAPLFKLEGNTGYYVWPAKIGEAIVDVPMFIDTQNDAGISGKRGKVDIQSNRAQVNGGTVFVIPALNGMVVKVTATNTGKASAASMTFNGAEADEYADGVLTFTYAGSETTLSIIDQGNDLYPSSISVEYPSGSITPTKLTFDETIVKAVLGESFTAPSLTTDPDGLTGIVYSSSDETVATVNSSTGEVSIIGLGTAKITASFEGNDSYGSSQTSYTLSVETPAVSEKDWDFSTWDETDYAGKSVVDGLEVCGISSEKPISVKGGVLKFGGSGSKDGRYIRFKIAEGAHLISVVAKHASSSGDPRALRISFGAFGSDVKELGSVVATANPATFYYTYEGKETYIYIYSGSSGINLSSLSVSPTNEVPVTVATDMATYVTPFDMDFSGIEGLKAYVVSEVTATSATLEEVGAVPANTPLLLEGKGMFTVPVASSASAPAANELKAGSATMADGDYILKGGKFVRATAESVLPAGKAYISVPAGAREIEFVYSGATAISELKGAEVDDAVYTLSGVRVKSAQKGVYILNGKKIVK